MKLHSVSRSSSSGGGDGGGDGGGGSRTLADGLDSAVYTILSQYSRRQCRRLLLASLVAMVYTVWWLLLIPTVVVCMYYWVYRRRGGAGARWRHASLYDRRSRRHCRRRPAQRARLSPSSSPLSFLCLANPENRDRRPM